MSRRGEAGGWRKRGKTETERKGSRETASQKQTHISAEERDTGTTDNGKGERETEIQVQESKSRSHPVGREATKQVESWWGGEREGRRGLGLGGGQEKGGKPREKRKTKGEGEVEGTQGGGQKGGRRKRNPEGGEKSRQERLGGQPSGGGDFEEASWAVESQLPL